MDWEEPKRAAMRILDTKIIGKDSPVQIVPLLEAIILMCKNVMDHPDDMKYRRAKTGSNFFQTNIAKVTAGMELLLAIGWTLQPFEMREHLIFHHDARRLAPVIELLEETLLKQAEQREKTLKALELKKKEMDLQKNRVLQQIADDQRMREKVDWVAKAGSSNVKALDGLEPRRGAAGSSGSMAPRPAADPHAPLGPGAAGVARPGRTLGGN